MSTSESISVFPIQKIQHQDEISSASPLKTKHLISVSPDGSTELEKALMYVVTIGLIIYYYYYY